jgi:hypothetical protein
VDGRVTDVRLNGNVVKTITVYNHRTLYFTVL